MTNITQALATHAEVRPSDVALRCGERQLTWKDLAKRVAVLGAWMASRTPTGGSIAIDMPTSLEFALAFLGAAHAGRRAVVYDRTWSEQIRTDVEASLGVDLRLTPETFPEIENLPTPDEKRPALVSETPLMVGFTSGSTGRVKGYERNHRSWVESIRAAQPAFELTPGDRVCAPGSVSFSLFLYALVHCIHVGASLRLCTQFRPKRILGEMRADKCTVLLAVPTQAKVLIDAACRSAQSVSDELRLVITSGAKWRGDLSDAQRRAINDARILEFYGASETSFISIAHIDDGTPPHSVGKPFKGVEIDIRAADGRSLPAGETGKIWVKSAMLFTRYVVGDSPESAWEGGYLTVGDHGYLDAAGFLYIAGREKRMLVTAGANLYPEAVENVIAGHRAIENVSVIGIDEAVRGQRVVAFLKLKAGSERPSVFELSDLCRSRLGRHATPSKFYVVDDWPVAASGKTDFDALLQRVKAFPACPQL